MTITTPSPIEADAEVAAVLRERYEMHSEARAKARAVAAEYETELNKASEELTRITRARNEVLAALDRHTRLAAAFETALNQLDPSAAIPPPSPPAPSEGSGPEQVFRPFIAAQPSAEPSPSVISLLRPHEQCGVCRRGVQWDEQNGFSHAEDGTPAGGLCEKRGAL